MEYPLKQLTAIFGLCILAGLTSSPLTAKESDGLQPIGRPAGSLNVVLVGFNTYELRPGEESVISFGNLKYAAADATEIYDQLLSYGIPEQRIKLFTDTDPASTPTFVEVDRYVKQLQTSENDTLIFMYFGHGLNVGNQSYLCFPQTRVEGNLREGLLSVNEALSLDSLVRTLSEKSAANKLIITDACRNLGGSIVESDTESISRFDLTPSLQRATFTDGQSRQMAIISSCLPGQISREVDEFGHGLFAHGIINGLTGEADYGEFGNRNGVLTMNEVYHYARAKTIEYFPGINYGQNPFWEGLKEGQIELVSLSDERRNEFLVKYGNDFDIVRKPLGYREQLAVMYFDQAIFSIFADPSLAIELCTKAIEQKPSFNQAYILRSTMKIVRGDFVGAFDDFKDIENRALELKVPKSLELPIRGETDFKVFAKLEPETMIRIRTVSVENTQRNRERGDYMLISHVAAKGTEDWEEKVGWIETKMLDALTPAERTDLIKRSQLQIGSPALTYRQNATAQQNISLDQFGSGPGTEALQMAEQGLRIWSAVDQFESGNIQGGINTILQGQGLPIQQNLQRLDPNQYIPAPIRQIAPSIPGPSSIPYVGGYF